MSRSETIRRGSCLCQAVKYEIKGDPITFRVCHCVNCRKASGSAFTSNGVFLRTQVNVVEGQTKVFRDRNTRTGVPLDRHFCSECGSSIFFVTTDPEPGKRFLTIGLGTLDDEMDWLPKSELFSEQQRHWVKGINLRQKRGDAKL